MLSKIKGILNVLKRVVVSFSILSWKIKGRWLNVSGLFSDGDEPSNKD